MSQRLVLFFYTRDESGAMILTGKTDMFGVSYLREYFRGIEDMPKVPSDVPFPGVRLSHLGDWEDTLILSDEDYRGDLEANLRDLHGIARFCCYNKARESYAHDGEGPYLDFYPADEDIFINWVIE